jgi:uncharacterized caspase-like protein
MRSSSASSILVSAVVAALVSLALTLGAGPSWAAEKRVALVIGNSAYKRVVQLPNPARDAAAMAELLKRSGFDVVESRNDLNNTDMRRAIRDFSFKAQDADIAVVFYAGHGMEVDGTNYLLPVDAVLERDLDVEDEAVSLDRIVKVLEPVKRLRLIILDACRDNPFAGSMKKTIATRSIGRGLAKVEVAVSDTMIAFAAKAGSTAGDGDNGNSPFTTALLNNITTPGLDLRIAFGRVRDEVLRATNNRQEPFVYGSLGGDTVALVPQKAAPVDPNATARQDYEFAAQIGTKQAWDSFLAVHASGLYADLARAQYEKLKAAEQASAKAEEAQRSAEQQAKTKSEDFRRQLEEQGARQAEEVKKRLTEQAKRDLDEERRKVAENSKREVDEARRQAEAAQLQAEDARRQIEEAKRQAVEDARRQVAEAKRQADEAKRAAAAEALRVTALEAKRASEQKLALAVQPPASEIKPAPVVVVPAMDPADLRRLLQAHLKRVGCDPDIIDGNWNEGSRKALDQFNKNAGTNFDVKLASLDALDAVRAKTSRVCPLVCGKGQRAEGDRCLQITCESGFVLGPNGVCHKRPEPAARSANREPAPRAAPGGGGGGGGGGGKCFTFNGKRFCE